MTPLLDSLRNLGKRLGTAPAEPALAFPDTLNIESSYACNLKCWMCPRHFDESLQGMFPMPLFRDRVAPHLGKFRYVSLTGWGEPLMNRDLPEMLELIKTSGAHASFSTNGLLLKEPLSRRIIETGVDSVQVSCDASQPHTYEIVRGKGTFDVLMKRLEHMKVLAAEYNKPRLLDWVFVLMKSNLAELPEAVRLAGKHGMARFHAKHMETAINREDLDNALWNTGIAPPLTAEWEDKLAATLDEAQRAARESGVELVLHPRQFVRDGCQCLTRPAHQVFIDYRGFVSSCCYLNKLDVMPYRTPEERTNDEGVMGNLNDDDLEAILASDRDRRFRLAWLKGEIPRACHGCLNLNRMEAGA